MSAPVQGAVLLALALVAGFYVRRAVVSAMADPGRFPVAKWGAPEGVFSGGIVAFFLWMAFASMGREPVRITVESVVASFVLYLSICILVIGFLVVRGINPVQAFGLRWENWRHGIFCIPAALFLAFPFIYIGQWLVYQISGPAAEPQPIVDFLLKNPDWSSRLAVAGVAVVAAPLTEELIFRGCLYGVVRKFAGRWAGMFFTSVVFALIHGHLPSLPGLFLLAIALTLVYERTGSLWAPIGLHAIFNGLTVMAAVLWPDLAG